MNDQDGLPGAGAGAGAVVVVAWLRGGGATGGRCPSPALAVVTVISMPAFLFPPSLHAHYLGFLSPEDYLHCLTLSLATHLLPSKTQPSCCPREEKRLTRDDVSPSFSARVRHSIVREKVSLDLDTTTFFSYHPQSSPIAAPSFNCGRPLLR